MLTVLCATTALNIDASALSRRAVLGGATAALIGAPPALALESLVVDENKFKKADIGLLDEIPPNAKKAYLQ